MINPLDQIAEIRIRLYCDGAVSVEGNVGDARMADQMIQAARDAIKSQVFHREGLVSDRVGIAPNPGYPVMPLGDS